MIVAVTAYDTYGIKEAALEAGCDAYLTKPVELDGWSGKSAGSCPAGIPPAP